MKANIAGFRILLLAVAVTLVGCAQDRFAKVGPSIPIGDKIYDELISVHTDPWGASATTITLLESKSGRIVRQQTFQGRVDPKDVLSEKEKRCVEKTEYVSSEKYDTRVVNNNNQGCIGYANNMFQGAVGDSIMGASTMGAAALLRPARINVSGGSASASSSSSSAAAAAASSQ